MNLEYLERIYFEINDECPLTDVHKGCPRNSDRRKKLRREKPTTNEEFINFVNYCIESNYMKQICTWYYNEPLSTPERLAILVDSLPECKFNLWTNGVLLKGNEELLKRMDWVMVTRYRETDLNTLDRLMKSNGCNITSKRGVLDRRINTDIEPHFNRRRIHCPQKIGSEISIDYYGSIHFCCMDWMGEIEIGNIQDHSPEFLIKKWNEWNLRMNQSWNEKTFPDIPHVCQLCTMWLPFWRVKQTQMSCEVMT